MKRGILFIILLSAGAVLSAQVQPLQTQYTVTRLETGVRGGNCGAVVSHDGDIIFSGHTPEKDANGHNLTRLYMLRQGSSTPVMLFTEDAKEYIHMGAPYITADGRELYFAVSGKVKVTLSKGIFKSGEVYYPQQLVMSRRQADGNWGPIMIFRHNMDNYSSGDPWLSNDGQYLYFASNRPGGMGGIDLWRSRRSSDGSWNTPENLREVNTKEDERSPRFDTKGNFYYASGNGSIGGMDIFSCAILADGHFTPSVRMAAPLNSNGDDFAITFASDTKGYLSSNRSGEDAIYQFEKLSREVASRMTVSDYEGKPLEGVQLYFMSEQACDSKLVTTNALGELSVDLEPDAPYNLLAYKKEYIPKEFMNQTLRDLMNKKISLESYPVCSCPDAPCLEYTDPGVKVKMSSVHFDLSRWNIRPDAARELNLLVTFMKDNPSADVVISAYTDCRGSASLNMVLSQRRANAVKEYLASKGIAARRITAVGYGKTQLLNRCDCILDCSDREHEENRRAEYMIVNR